MEAKQVPETQIHIYSRLKSMVFYIVRRGWGGGGVGAERLIHLMPQCCLSCKASFCSQKCWTDTKNRQKSLQDTLCAIASHRQQDKAISSLDTSLAHSPQLSHGTGLTVALLLALALCYSGASTIKIHTNTIQECRALMTKGQIRGCKKHLFNRRFMAFLSRALSWILTTPQHCGSIFTDWIISFCTAFQYYFGNK